MGRLKRETMDNYLSLMMQSKLFEGFSNSDCQTIYSLLQPNLREFSRNEIIVNEGDRVEDIGILCAGRIMSVKIDYLGNTHLMEILQRPMIFGIEIVTTPSQISPITMISTEKSSILVFSYHRFMAKDVLLDQFRVKVLNNIMHLLANENVKKMYKIEVLSKRSLRNKILIHLHLMEKKAGGSPFSIGMDREQFAQYLCVNRSALSHELSTMKKEGLIFFHKDIFTIFYPMTNRL